MDEQQWLACTDPTPMLRFLLGTDYPRVQAVEAFPDCQASDRKLRLFACACYGRIRHLLPDPRARDGLPPGRPSGHGVASAESTGHRARGSGP